jgi:hypothetical protein
MHQHNPKWSNAADLQLQLQFLEIDLHHEKSHISQKWLRLQWHFMRMLPHPVRN